ncbi:transglutaminase-like domain-containing protein [Desulfosarcina ovata]|uniref:Transglutaminase-like domain-containing protein n=1 Tax=Desulfosarcina ovata subsp. ovata TaxID=2752305 RepID=A0A5K8AJC5_9BACT|nr:transglutaminase-like domain-containing protein [Desulfosarcina ovata]BBO91774.1 hypothetical protein DSCOOX_49540 [Desulfosarcina ovata subsp. ovata]
MNGNVTIRILSVIVIPVIGLIIGMQPVFHVDQQARRDVLPVNEMSRTVLYRFHIHNSTNQPVHRACFHLYAPVKQTSTQRCTKIQSSHPYEMKAEAGGNQMMIFPLATVPPYASKIVSIRASLIMRTTPWETGPFGSYLIATIENKNIRNLAQKLRSDTPRETADNIYRWIIDHIQFTGYTREEKGASCALARREGDCTEFADLFVAISRAAGLPARRVSGYLIPEGEVLKPGAYHDWAEFYERGAWRIADAQQRNFDMRYPDYVATRIAPPVLSAESAGGFHQFYIEGDGLTVKMD